MPLPDAPPPKTSRVYQQFAGKLLSTITPTNFETVKDPVYIDRNSEDEIRRLNLIAQATNTQSQSGPIPGTFTIASCSATDAGRQDLFVPSNDGSVWQIVGLALGGVYTGQSSTRCYLSTGASPSYLNEVQLNGPTTDDYTAFELNEPIYLEYPAKVEVSFGGTGSGGQSNVTGAFIRVR